ncbi:MAG: lysophospholipase [Myxococcales bacterium]|nr:lysophospholipase [Myxococcales bacterium]
MTTLVDQGAERTGRPESLSTADKIRVLLFGVTIPRPPPRYAASEFGLRTEGYVIDGPLGPLELLRVGTGSQVVVLVHGYASERTDTFPTARRLVDLGFTVVAPNLRGAGASEGDRTSLGWHEAEDVAAVVRWVGDTLGDREPILYGFSMGGAAVLGAVARARAPAEAVVTECTFDRLPHTIGHRFAAMGLPRRGLSDLMLFWGGLQQGFDAWRVAPVVDASRVTVPTLVVGGELDRRVLPSETRALAGALGEHGQLAIVEGMGHAQLARSQPDTWDRVVAPFLRPFLRSAGSAAR